MRRVLAALALFAATGEASAETIGSWSLKFETDAMTDRRDAVASVSNADSSALLTYSCFRARNRPPTAFFLTTREYLGGVGNLRFRDLLARIDDQPAETMQWEYADSTANTTSTRDNVGFGNLLRSGTKLKVRAYSYRGVPVDAEFDVTRASEMMDRVNLECRKPAGVR